MRTLLRDFLLSLAAQAAASPAGNQQTEKAFPSMQTPGTGQHTHAHTPNKSESSKCTHSGREMYCSLSNKVIFHASVCLCATTGHCTREKKKIKYINQIKWLYRDRNLITAARPPSLLERLKKEVGNKSSIYGNPCAVGSVKHEFPYQTTAICLCICLCTPANSHSANG